MATSEGGLGRGREEAGVGGVVPLSAVFVGPPSSLVLFHPANSLLSLLWPSQK